MCLNSTKLLIRKLFLDGVGSVRPDKLISSILKVENDHVIINSRKYNLSNGKCYIIGYGKAVTDMAFTAEAILKNKFHKGILSVPQGLDVNNREFSKLKIYNGALNNMPDENSVRATEEIVKLVEEATENDLVLVMISGGGSALLSKPTQGVKLKEKQSLIESLAKSGADIKELNCIRKRISDVKGGKLSKYIYPAQSVSFILSDIVGDPLDLIASGSTVKNTEPSSKALDILKKYNLLNKRYENIVKVIKEDVDLEDRVFKNVENIVLANNRVALEAVIKQATEEGYATVLLSSCIEGNVDTVSNLYARLAHLVLNSKDDLSGIYINRINLILKELAVCEKTITEVENILINDSKKICFLFGGETVVNVKGKGLGGRNQELVLRFSTEFDQINEDNLNSESKVMFLSGGTDGIDGPTDAAGALTYPGQSVKAKQQGLDPQRYLDTNDSYNYFKQLDSTQDLLKIGHTGINLMDLHILLIQR